MSLIFIYAASLAVTFVAWYLCLLIPNRPARGVIRAAVIALLCSPGIIVGHGVGVAPTVVALYVQPFIFTYVPILIVWVIALGVIFGVPALRNDRSQWPPSAKDIFLDFYAVKLALIGLVTAMLMYSLIYADQRHDLWVEPLKYMLFFSAAIVNLTLCYGATRTKQAKPLVVPLFFSAPVLLVSPPNVALMWYGGGAIGGLIGSGQQRVAVWIALGVFGLLSFNSTFRIYLAATAQPHVTIGGGIAGNAAMAALFAALAVVPWWMFRRRAQGSAKTARSEQDQTGV